MTPRDARNWALSIYRARRDGPPQTLFAYLGRWAEALDQLPAEQRARCVAAYEAEKQRLEETEREESEPW